MPFDNLLKKIHLTNLSENACGIYICPKTDTAAWAFLPNYILKRIFPAGTSKYDLLLLKMPFILTTLDRRFL